MKYLFFLLLISSYSMAQDVIVKRDDSKLDAKILEIGSSTIVYKKFNSTDGKEYKINKKDVMEIRYQNGEVEQISGPSGRTTYTRDFGRHFISYNTLSLLFSNISFAYEYYFSTGYFGIKVPVTLGFSDVTQLGTDNSIYSIGLNKMYSGGVDFNFYPGGQGRFRYFLGTGMEFGSFHYYRNYYNYNSPSSSPYGSNYNTRHIGTYFAIPFKNGLHIQPTKNFNIQLSTGVGLGRSNADYGDYSYVDLADNYFFYWNTSLNLGVRF